MVYGCSVGLRFSVGNLYRVFGGGGFLNLRFLAFVEAVENYGTRVVGVRVVGGVLAWVSVCLVGFVASGGAVAGLVMGLLYRPRKQSCG